MNCVHTLSIEFQVTTTNNVKMICNYKTTTIKLSWALNIMMYENIDIYRLSRGEYMYNLVIQQMET